MIAEQKTLDGFIPTDTELCQERSRQVLLKNSSKSDSTFSNRSKSYLGISA